MRSRDIPIVPLTRAGLGLEVLAADPAGWRVVVRTSDPKSDAFLVTALPTRIELGDDAAVMLTKAYPDPASIVTPAPYSRGVDLPPERSVCPADGISDVPAKTSLPEGWDDLWGHPGPDLPDLEWRRLKRLTRELAEDVGLVDRSSTFGPLVGAGELLERPVHRWFAYKEGYSPQLLGAVLDGLHLGDSLHVSDPFGGVATTALAGLADPRVAEVRSVDYSPLAHFVGSVKLSWPFLEPERLGRLLPAALSYPSNCPVKLPDLAAFANPEIFHPQRIRALLRARDHLRQLPRAKQVERDFFLLGLAAVTEDLSGVMKDGRALRIVRQRRRRASSLAHHKTSIRASGAVKQALAGQWTAMIEDLEVLREERAAAQTKLAVHLRGDARSLATIRLLDDQPAFPDGWADLACFSPPYLNCVDYTEVHKLELWLLDYVTNQAEFKQTRLGTLRSHPSVRFSERNYIKDLSGQVIDLVDGASQWVRNYGARREVGPVIKQYFDDMFQVWREQHRVLKPSGVAACVVANSTFSRRKPGQSGIFDEEWRLPVLTDVILAHLAKAAGFDTVQIWHARDLRPRNVRFGRARESVVVAWKT
jgi:hypothetical protein